MLQEVRWLSGAPVLFALALLFFARGKAAFYHLQRQSIRYSYAALHVAALVCLGGLQHYTATHNLNVESASYQWVARSWTGLLVVAIASLVATFCPPRTWWAMARSLGAAWVYASLCTAAIVLIRHFASISWNANTSYLSKFLIDACFHQTQAVLQLFYPQVIAVPQRHYLGTPHFIVDVAWLCSGIEGLLLILVLVTIWLISMRRQVRVGRALLLLPVALASIWFLNILRLAILISIGSAGHAAVAENGFHAQAGWITLNLAALSFLLFVQRVPWFWKSTDAQVAPLQTEDLALPEASWRNTTTLYLLPFTAITAASILSQAVSSGFEWLYPLRFLIALLTLWIFRKQYRAMDWTFSWLGPCAGLVVSVFWLALHFALHHEASSVASTVEGLERLTPAAHITWVVIRILAVVVTVPIAEELTFRGFLARRIVTADFDELPYSRLTWLSLLLSAAAFGAMHGHMWFAGTLSGVLFGWVAKRKNRLGEAFIAHATANFLIALVALYRNDYSLW